METYYEAYKTLNSYGVRKVVTVNEKTQRVFVRSCFTKQSADVLADKLNKELKKEN